MELLEVFTCEGVKAARQREAYWIEQTKDCVNRVLPSRPQFPAAKRKVSSDNILSEKKQKCELALEEPISMEKLKDIIAFIKSREHILLEPGKDRQHDKVREVLLYLEEMEKQPKRKEYHYSHGIGRRYVNGEGSGSFARTKSMQGCFKGLRAPLIGHIGHDMDIENAQPSLTVQWLEKLVDLGKADLTPDDFSLLKDYVDDRATWLSEIQKYHGCDREAAKTLVILTLFGGDPKYHLKQYATLNVGSLLPRLEGMVDQLSLTRHKVVTFQNKDPRYYEMYKRKLCEKGSEEAAIRSAFSIYQHELEDCVIEKIMEYLLSQNIDIFSLIYDGLIVSDCSEEIMRGAEAYVLQFGWTIRLAEKPLYGLHNQKIPELAPLY